MSPIEKSDTPAALDYHHRQRQLHHHQHYVENFDNHRHHQHLHLATALHKKHNRNDKQYVISANDYRQHNRNRHNQSLSDHDDQEDGEDDDDEDDDDDDDDDEEEDDEECDDVNDDTKRDDHNDVTAPLRQCVPHNEMLLNNNKRNNHTISDDNNNSSVSQHHQSASHNNIKNTNKDKAFLDEHGLYESIDDLPKCQSCDHRQLFGIQLEVTSLLLEAERRKLAVLQRELQVALEESGSLKKAKEQFKQELILAISRIQLQYDLLENEYRQHAIGRLRNSNYRGLGKSNRSQPAIGLKQTPKSRPTIFGTVASDQCPKDSVNRKGFPQTTSCIKSSSSIDKTQQHATGAQPAQSQHALSSHSPQSNVLRSQLHDQPHHYLHHHHHHHHRHHLHSHHQQQHSHHHHHHQHATVGGSHKPLDNEENALVYRDGNLISGPLDTLIQHMVPTSDYYPDRSYLFAFLLSARLFIRPHELLAKICHLCNEQQDLNCTSDCRCSCSAMLDQSASGSGVDQVDQVSRKPLNNQLPPPVDLQKYRCCEAGASVGTPDTKPCPAYCDDQQPSECCRKLRQFAQHFVRLLAEWIDTFPYDFRDERLMQHVRAMTRKCIGIDSSLRKDVQTMLQELLQRLTVLERYEEFLLSLSQNYGTDGPNNATSTTTSSADSDGGSSVKNNANAAAAAMGLTKPASSILTIQNNLHSVGGSPAGGDGLIQSATIGVGQPLLTTSSSTSSAASGSGGSGGASNAYAVDISQLCPSPFLLAHQLTHIELERLSYIGPEEFVQAFAKENPHLEQSFSDMKKTRNLESYVQWFNRLSYLVATEIVKHPKKKQRVRIVEYWIETARECFNIGNFNSLMAIIAGLNMSPISRLKKTWSKVQCAKFLVLEHQMDPSSNFNSYRSTLKAAMWRSEGATDERERIVIPFFSLLVKDLYFLNEGCSNKLVNGHINFEKFWQLAKQVTEFIAWKQVSCPFEKLPKVIMFLQSSCVLNENRLAIASFECEPPENNHEKERYKSLKYEQHNSQHGQHQQQHQ